MAMYVMSPLPKLLIIDDEDSPEPQSRKKGKGKEKVGETSI